MFKCLVNKSSLSLSKCSTIKQAKFKYNNVFLNIRIDLTIYNITFLYVYLSKNILIQA